MNAALNSLLATGTKLWLDSVDPDLARENRAWGATGATSNPIIVADLIASGRFDTSLEKLLAAGHNDARIAWQLTDDLVREAQDIFLPVWEETAGDNGYVSFELDPLLEDPQQDLPHEERVAAYVELGKKWSTEHRNRMIKVPATPAGLAALPALTAAGVPLNVTLIFTQRQYMAARDAVWQGAQQLKDLARFKSVYSIFVSRVDVYTHQHVPQLPPAAQGMVGIVGAKRMWAANQAFWQQHHTPLAQEIVFASTGTKNADDPPWKYVAALAGGDIQTNPPATNQAVADSTQNFSAQLAELPADNVLAAIDAEVDYGQLERVLMEEGVAKFVKPQHQLLRLIAEKRAALSPT